MNGFARHAAQPRTSSVPISAFSKYSRRITDAVMTRRMASDGMALAVIGGRPSPHEAMSIMICRRPRWHFLQCHRNAIARVNVAPNATWSSRRGWRAAGIL